jgi:hypothetical protein
MADDTTNLTDPTDFSSIGNLLGKGFIEAMMNSGIPKAALAAFMQNETARFALGWKLFLDAITFVAEKYEQGEQAIQPIAERAIAPILAGLFGANVSGGDFSRRMGAGGGDDAARAIVAGFLSKVTGSASGPVEPGTEGSERLAAAAVAASIESTINALIPELVSDFLPFDLGKISALVDLPEGVLRALGVGRLVRRAFTPAIDATCTTPAKWHYAKLYRQTLLGPPEIAKQYARGKWDVDQAKELLARHGYDDASITAILDDTAKFLTVAQVFRLIRANAWSDEDGRQHLLDAGYFSDDVDTLLLLERLADIEAFEREQAHAAVDAFAAGRIDETTLGGFVSGSTITAQEKAQFVELAHTRRICQAKPLTSSEAATLVMDGILDFIDYRDALARENRTDDAITVLELALRKKVDDKKTLDEHKAAAAAAKATADAAKQAAAAAKKTAADQAAAVKALGPQADVEQAAIRGLIPLVQVQQLYTLKYGADAAGTLFALLQAKRQAYLDAQAAHDAATKKAATKGANLAEIEAAVLNGVITLPEYATQIAALGFDGASVQLLTETLQAKIAARDQAARLHAQAVADAKVKHIDLPTLELLVRRGHVTMSDFTAQLQTLGYDQVAIAELQEKLQLEIDGDAAAAKVKADAAAKLAAKGLTLEQERRAVILGIAPIAAFTPWLLANGIGVDAAKTLTDELQADVDAAKAAAAKRAGAAAKANPTQAPLADVHRAVVLGLIPVSDYIDRLTAAGYTAADVSLEQDLLVQEIAAQRVADALKATAAAKSPAAGLSLAQLEKAVKAGEAPITDYTARAIAIGFSDADAATLTRVLQDAVDAAAALEARKAALNQLAPQRELARADIVKAVTDGLQTLDDYAAWLAKQGYDQVDADLLVAELQQTLAAKAPPPAPGP